MSIEVLPNDICDNQTKLRFRALDNKIISVESTVIGGIDYCKIIAQEPPTHYTIDSEISITYSRAFDDKLANLRVYFAEPNLCVLDTSIECDGYLSGYSPDEYAHQVFATFKFIN